MCLVSRCNSRLISCIFKLFRWSKRNITTGQQQDEVRREFKLGYFGVLLLVEDVGLDLQCFTVCMRWVAALFHRFIVFLVESVVAEMLVQGVHTTHRLVVFVDNFGLVDVHFLPRTSISIIV